MSHLAHYLKYDKQLSYGGNTHPPRHHPLNENKVDQSVEALCAQGCGKVHGFIEKLKRGQKLPETRGLTSWERAKVLDTLVDVMDTYQACRHPALER